MKDQDASSPLDPGLRARAERLLRGDPDAREEFALPSDLLAALQAAQHELSVHQIELRLQNETLQQKYTELQAAYEELGVARAQAQGAHAKYQRLFDEAPVGYLTLGRDGRVLEANQASLRQLGLEREQLLHSRLSRFVPEVHATSFALFLRRAFAGPERATLDLPVIRPDGPALHVQLEATLDSGSPDFGAANNSAGKSAGAPGTLLVTMTDITLQKAAQEEVLRLNQTLEDRVEERAAQVRELGDELETLVYAVTHDLFTPLRHVRSFAGLLAGPQRGTEAQREQYLGHIVSSVERMESMLQSLLQFFRAGRQRAPFRSVNLNRVIEEVCKDLAAELQDRDVRLTWGKLPTVWADAVTLQLAFANLLSNALKFTRGQVPSVIHVGAEDRGHEWVVWVEDNGAGFNMRQKERLFGVFSRLHRQEEFEGNGVGLALVRRIVLRHGGRVWAEGRPHQGATFWIAFPKQPAD